MHRKTFATCIASFMGVALVLVSTPVHAMSISDWKANFLQERHEAVNDWREQRHDTLSDWREQRSNAINDVREQRRNTIVDLRTQRREAISDWRTQRRDALAELRNRFNHSTSTDDGDNNTGTTTLPTSCTPIGIDLNTVDNFPPTGDGPIIAFGDSLTEGVGASPGQDYVSELEDKLGEDIINAGVSGDTTQDALDRLDRDVLSKDPSAVIVWLGGNDILLRYYEELENEAASEDLLDELEQIIYELFGTIPDTSDVPTESETFANLQTIIDRIQATGATVILVGMSGEPLDDNLSGEYRDLAEDEALYVPDVLDGVFGNPIHMSDLIHPDDSGYDIVANRIYGAASCLDAE